MATASAPGPALAPVARGTSHVLRVFVLPAIVAVAALVIAASFGHALIGLLLAVGVALGAVNGLLMEAATERLTAQPEPQRKVRKVVVKSSLGRLGLITAVALVIAILARPHGWVLLLGLACYQLLSLAALLGTAAREARLG